MNYIEFSGKMQEYPFFSTRELRLVFGKSWDRSFLNNLKNWEKKGYIIRLRKSLYALGHLKNAVDPMVFASKLYQPSYVSLKTALSYYGIIPEAVFSTTSATSRETAQFSNDIGLFRFRKVKKSAYGGYETIQNKDFGISFNLALPEKALADFFYLNRNILDGSRQQFEGYRFSDEFRYNKNRLLEFAKAFGNKKGSFLIEKFINFYVAR